MDEWASKYGGFRNPKAKIFVNSKEIPIDGSKDGIKVSSIRVEKSVGCEASTCAVEIKWERTQDDSHIPPFAGTFKLGAKLKIELGYEKKVETVFVGYISSIEFDIGSNSSDIILLINGMDGKIWMMSNCKSELIKGASTYDAAVKNVFNSYAAKFEGGNEVKISGAPKLKVPIYQLNESDYEFVCRMAFLAGALFFVDNGKVKFIDMYSEKTAKSEIEKSNVSRIHMSIDLCGIPEKVETVFQDKKHFKDTIKGAASKSDDIGKGSAASSVSKNVKGKITLVDNTLCSAKEADFFSKAEQNRRNSNFVNLKIDLQNGIPDLKLGSVYKIDKVGDMVDNSFMIYSIKHIISERKGFISSVVLRSSVLNEPKGI